MSIVKIQLRYLIGILSVYRRVSFSYVSRTRQVSGKMYDKIREYYSPRQIVAVNLLFYVRACPHSGDYSGTSLGVRSVALLHSQATLAPLLLFDIHAPLYIVKKEAKSITSFATFFIFCILSLNTRLL